MCQRIQRRQGNKVNKRWMNLLQRFSFLCYVWLLCVLSEFSSLLVCFAMCVLSKSSWCVSLLSIFVWMSSGYMWYNSLYFFEILHDWILMFDARVHESCLMSIFYLDIKLVAKKRNKIRNTKIRRIIHKL